METAVKLKTENERLLEALFLKDIPEIAMILKISNSELIELIEEREALNSLPEFTEEMTDKLISYWRDELTNEQIAKRMDLMSHQVYYQLRKLCLN